MTNAITIAPRHAVHVSSITYWKLIKQSTIHSWHTSKRPHHDDYVLFFNFFFFVNLFCCSVCLMLKSSGAHLSFFFFRCCFVVRMNKSVLRINMCSVRFIIFSCFIALSKWNEKKKMWARIVQIRKEMSKCGSSERVKRWFSQRITMKTVQKWLKQSKLKRSKRRRNVHKVDDEMFVSVLQEEK